MNASLPALGADALKRLPAGRVTGWVLAANVNGALLTLYTRLGCQWRANIQSIRPSISIQFHCKA